MLQKFEIKFIRKISLLVTIIMHASDFNFLLSIEIANEVIVTSTMEIKSSSFFTAAWNKNISEDSEIHKYLIQY